MLWGVIAAAIAIVAFVPPIPQPLAYHRFADTRELFGVANFWNVVSNVPFMLVGCAGLTIVVRNRYAGGLDSSRFVYGAVFLAVAFVALGSAYYHLRPDNETLVWDRLPMALAFMALISVVVGEHVDSAVARILFIPLLALGALSVWYWHYTESLGRGDLRLYGLVQFLSILVVGLILALFRSRLSGTVYLWGMFAGYAAAKILEEFDQQVYDATANSISGHSLKHVVAATAMFLFVMALMRRHAISEGSASGG